VGAAHADGPLHAAGRLNVCPTGATAAACSFAWVGHFVFEKNRPATFKYPLWSLRADFRLHRLVLLGQMGPHDALAIKRYGAKSS
jgi:hypothetical protein